MNRGDSVLVNEDGIRPWSGTVKALKSSRGVLFAEIERDGTDHECWIVRSSDVALESEPGQQLLAWGA